MKIKNGQLIILITALCIFSRGQSASKIHLPLKGDFLKKHKPNLLIRNKLVFLDNCLKISPVNSLKCSVCSHGYYPSLGNCVRQNVNGCLVYQQNTNNCMEFVPKKVKARFLEGETIPNCSQQTGEECSKCNKEFYLSEGKCIVKTLTNCLDSLENQNACKTCEAGFFVQNNGECKKQEMDGCAAFKDNTNECVKCSNLFYLSDTGKCLPINGTHCGKSDGLKNACLECSDVTFYLSQDRVCEKQQLAHCLSFVDSTNECAQCESLFFIRENGECASIDDKECGVSDGLINICTDCLKTDHYLNIDNVCVAQQIENCQAFRDFTNECIKCKNLFVLDDNQCTKISKKNCLNSDGIRDTCIDCIDVSFYIADSGDCVARDVANCAEYVDKTNKCKKCSNLFFLSNASSCSSISSTLCSKSDGLTDKCSQCSDSSYYVDPTGICTLQRINHCSEYAPFKNECSKCHNLHFVKTPTECGHLDHPFCSESDGINFACKLCSEVKYYVNGNGKCTQQNIENCKFYNDFENKCRVCNSLFFVAEDDSCSKVSSTDCDLSDGVNDACAKCSSADKFVNKSGLCVPQNITRCTTYNDYKNECKECDSLSYLEDDGTCSPINSLHCSKSDGVNNACVRCKEANYFVNGKGLCVLQDLPNCLVFKDFTNECKTCENLFYLELDLTCVAIKDKKCTKSDGLNEACAICQLGSYSDANGVCTAQSIPNCQKYVDNKNECALCENLYSIESQGACLPLNITSCIKSNGVSKTCVQCESKYFLSNSVLCSQIAGFETCKQSAGFLNRCDECLFMFYLNKVKVCVPNTISNCAKQTNLTTCEFCNCLSSKLTVNSRDKCVSSPTKNGIEFKINGVVYFSGFPVDDGSTLSSADLVLQDSRAESTNKLKMVKSGTTRFAIYFNKAEATSLRSTTNLFLFNNSELKKLQWNRDEKTSFQINHSLTDFGYCSLSVQDTDKLYSNKRTGNLLIHSNPQTDDIEVLVRMAA